MNTRQLKYIVTIAEERNITTAAKKLYISQPSLSSLLAHVEEEVGVKLFDRSSSPIIPTYAGECYIDAAKKILRIQNDLQNQIDDIIDFRVSRLILGCSTSLSSLLLPAILTEFMKKNPGVQIKLYEESVPVLIKLLDEGVLELVLTNALIDNKNFERVPIYSEEILLLAPSDFVPPATYKIENYHFPLFDLSCLDEHPFVLFKPNHQLRETVDRIFSDFSVQPKIILETDSWEICYSMVEKGLAFTFLPFSPLRKFLTVQEEINFFSIKGKYHRQFSIYYRKNTYHHKIIETFNEITKAFLQERI